MRHTFLMMLSVLWLLPGCRPAGRGEGAAGPNADEAPVATVRSPHADRVLPEADASAEAAQAAQATPTAETLRMVERLRQIVRSADPQKNPTLAPKANIARYQQELANEQRPDQRVLLRSHLGWQLLSDGQTEQALREFAEVRANLGELRLRPDHSFFGNLRELIAIAHLRNAEQQNCLANHSPESCIMPVRGGGIHRLREGAMAAREEFARALTEDPQDARSLWLLNLTYMTLGEYPDQVPPEWLVPPSSFESDYDIGRFNDVASSTGTDIVGLSGGVVADDLDGDGLLDIMASDWGLDKQLRLLINQGDGTFRDRTEAGGLIGEVGGLNLVQADYDNDGDVDVLVPRGAWLQNEGQHPNSLLRNRGNGTFDDVTESAGVLSFCPTQAACWADYDRDGWLDLFVGNETFDSKDFPCQLYHNNGDGTFTDVASKLGVDHLGRVKGATWGDYDNDGWPDLYLSRFGETNVLYHNQAGSTTDPRFVDVTAQAGVAQPLGSFPTWFWDYDNDGWLDILVAPYSGFKFDGTALRIVVAEYLHKPVSADRIHLYRNNHDGTFTNVGPELKLDAPLLAMGANFGDLDNDGYLDCYFGTGDPHFGTLVPNRAFRSAAGKVFQDVTTSGGFGHVQKGHGIAFADFDNDGDQDIYVVMGGAVAGDVYQNVLFENPGHGNHWLTLRLRGSRSNRLGQGARIRVQVQDAAGQVREIHTTVNSGGSFGASSLQQEIGLGDAVAIQRLDIEWPLADSRQTFTDVTLDRAYQVNEDDASLTPLSLPVIHFAHGPHEHVHQMP